MGAFKGYIDSLLELHVEVVPLGNVNVTSSPSPTPMPIFTQETQNPFVPSSSSTPSEPPQTQVPNDATVNLGESIELVPWMMVMRVMSLLMILLRMMWMWMWMRMP